eukprot:631346-Prymnesium_polylepis.1
MNAAPSGVTSVIADANVLPTPTAAMAAGQGVCGVGLAPRLLSPARARTVQPRVANAQVGIVGFEPEAVRRRARADAAQQHARRGARAAHRRCERERAEAGRTKTDDRKHAARAEQRTPRGGGVARAARLWLVVSIVAVAVAVAVVAGCALEEPSLHARPAKLRREADELRGAEVLGGLARREAIGLGVVGGHPAGEHVLDAVEAHCVGRGSDAGAAVTRAALTAGK